MSSSRKNLRAFRESTRSKAKDATRGVPTPDGGAPGGQSRRDYLKEYARWLWPYRLRLVVVFVLALVTSILTLALPLATKFIIDTTLPEATRPRSEKMSELILVCGTMIALILVSQSVDTIRQYLMAVLNAKVIFRLRQKLFERFLRLPLSVLSDLKSGGIVSRLSQDTDKVTGLVQMALVTPGVASLRVLLTVAVLFILSWQMALLATLMIPPIVLINVIWIQRVRPIYRAMARDREEIDARVTETFGGIRVVRGFQRERREQRQYAVAHHTVIRKKLLAEKLQLVVSSGWGFLIPGASLVIVGFGSYLVIEGRGTVGDIVAFQMYAMMLLHPVSMIVNSYSATQQALAAMERVFDILRKPIEKPDVPNAQETPSPIREIVFDSVGFEYREGLCVLEDISLTVPAGSVVALVGPSGGGKTTLTDLVARFYDPMTGAIRVNGVDLRDLRLASYRSRLAIVPQEVFLFDGSVRENIAYGKRHATDSAVEDAARRANAHEFIARLPEGYETVIGERGIKLSGGQRQRLSIARAVLADPEVLILDEATSNLDTESEQLIQASLADLFVSRTTFVIAHRLSTVTHADMIVVMDGGRVVEIGKHEALMAANGLYRDMVERQQSFAAVARGILKSEL
jgi:ABC-type multidrug transport system fused ATPase/permease subunit